MSVTNEHIEKKPAAAGSNITMSSSISAGGECGPCEVCGQSSFMALNFWESFEVSGMDHPLNYGCIDLNTRFHHSVQSVQE